MINVTGASSSYIDTIMETKKRPLKERRLVHPKPYMMATLVKAQSYEIEELKKQVAELKNNNLQPLAADKFEKSQQVA